MFLCTLTGHLLIKEQWKTCILWEVLQETLNCLLNLWNNFSHLPFFKGEKKLIFRGIPDASESPFSCFLALQGSKITLQDKSCGILRFILYYKWQIKGFHAFLHRNRRLHQLSNGLEVCITGTTIPAHLKVHQLHQRTSPSRKAGPGPASFRSTPCLSTKFLMQIKFSTSNTSLPSLPKQL